MAIGRPFDAGALTGPGFLARFSLYESRAVLRLSRLGRYPSIATLFLSASRLGDGPLWYTTAAVLLVFGGDSARWAALAAGCAALLSVLVFKAVKRVFGRSRPFEAWEDVPCLAAPPDRFSFPSGHTMTAFAVWSVFAQMLPEAAPFYLLLAVVIGLSRVFLGLHYPSDVAVGAVLGTTIGAAVTRCPPWFLSS